MYITSYSCTFFSHLSHNTQTAVESLLVITSFSRLSPDAKSVPPPKPGPVSLIEKSVGTPHPHARMAKPLAGLEKTLQPKVGCRL